MATYVCPSVPPWISMRSDSLSSPHTCESWKFSTTARKPLSRAVCSLDICIQSKLKRNGNFRSSPLASTWFYPQFAGPRMQVPGNLPEHDDEEEDGWWSSREVEVGWEGYGESCCRMEIEWIRIWISSGGRRRKREDPESEWRWWEVCKEAGSGAVAFHGCWKLWRYWWGDVAWAAWAVWSVTIWGTYVPCFYIINKLYFLWITFFRTFIFFFQWKVGVFFFVVLSPL